MEPGSRPVFDYVVRSPRVVATALVWFLVYYFLHHLTYEAARSILTGRTNGTTMGLHIFSST